MRFDRLRLSGFKSFVEPTELVIHDGLTGIVGPNGCGKSNLLEALRWVMGESSARSLRAASGGEGMETVIFAGTARRPSRDLAEVRLLLDNRDRRAPAPFNADETLEVSRAIVRGEGSTYAINGREVRLKDVQLLFADAATGAHSPALVSQGRVAGIIDARPAERRQLLEEAAGVSGLAVRRREAEQRLRAADANLERLADVMQAAAQQAQGLRRQARAAERYRALSAQIRAVEEALLRARLDAAVARLATQEQALRSADATLAEAVAAAARAASAQASAAAAMPGLREAEAVAAAILQRLVTERARLVAERDALMQRLRDLDAALALAIADRGREQDRAGDAAATRARLQAERVQADGARATAAQARAPLEEAVGAAERAATSAERALATAVEAHATLVADARSVRAAAEAASGRAERIEAEAARLAAELERQVTADRRAELADQVAQAETRVAAAAEAIAAAAERIGEAERAGAAARRALETVERALGAARQELASLEAEAAALERLRPRDGRRAGRRLPIAVRPGAERALAAAFADELEAGEEDGAPATARRWLRVGPGETDPPLPEGVTPLAAEVEVPAVLARSLAQVGIVESPPDAAALAALRPGQRLVSRDGWLWRWDGFCAPPGGTSAAVAEALAQETRRRAIAEAIAEPRARVAAAEAERRSQQAAVRQAQEAERRARAERSAAERQRDEAAARLAGHRAALGELEARAQATRAAVERLQVEGAAARSEAEQARAAVAALPDSSVAAAAVGVARQAAERARAALAEARAEAAAVISAEAQAQARLRRLDAELADWTARDERARSAAAELEDRVRQLAADRAALVAEPEARTARLALIDREVAAAEAGRAQAAEALMAAELALAGLDRQARSADTAVADAREARATAAAAAAQAREQVDALAADAQARFGLHPGALAKAGTGDPATLDSELARLVAERERLGVVNLRADIELAEVEAALAAQEAEKADLETAIARLRGSIGALNREGRARLMQAFAEVDRHFRDLFVTLFAGGAAELALVESEDVLEAGLEIRAQPPGKKLQSLSLLSGGEQALTAIALIFALFRTNPAPICVLDEVDAPLDDANVERFTRLLHHMAEGTATRFLIVTHNAVTMAAMNRLYGVTMAEPGISQLVSVDLEAATRIRDAA